MEFKGYELKGFCPDTSSVRPNTPISTICIGDSGHTLQIGVDKKFNWFQKKMIKWCFGFEVKENK